MGGQMALIILALVAASIFIARVIKSDQRHKERMAAKKETPEAVDLQPPAIQSRTVIPEIMAELNAMGEALDISRYALEASLGMQRTAWKAAREARKGDYNRDSPSGYAGYEPPESGARDRTQPAYYENEPDDDLDDWHFSDD